MAAPDIRYIKRRAGKGRSGGRRYARVFVPVDLCDRFGEPEAIERALHTGGLREAQHHTLPSCQAGGG